MRLAITADIHGNIQALEAVYADLKAFAPDLLIAAGDMVGGGPDSKAVLEFPSTIDHLAIKGTHEDLMLDVIAGRVEPTFLEARIAVAEVEMIGPH
jgi:Icc-related predicted phosphoesterase